MGKIIDRLKGAFFALTPPEKLLPGGTGTPECSESPERADIPEEPEPADLTDRSESFERF